VIRLESMPRAGIFDVGAALSGSATSPALSSSSPRYAASKLLLRLPIFAPA